MALPQVDGPDRQLEDAAREVAPWIVALARIGYLAKALLYATVGILAAQAALGSGGRTTDLGGALREVVRAPMGEAMLLVIAAGLAAYAVWRVVDAIFDGEGKGGDLKGVVRRIGSALRGLAHAGLALAAFRLGTGSGDGGGKDSDRYVAQAMDLPGGAWLVWLAAAVALGYCAYQLYRAYKAKLGRQLNLSALPAGLPAGTAALGWTIPATPAAGTTPAIATWTKPASVPYLNLFCDPLTYQCNSQETLEYATGVRLQTTKFMVNEKGVNFDGPLFDLPGGVVKAAVGATYTSFPFVQTVSDNTSAPA